MSMKKPIAIILILTLATFSFIDDCKAIGDPPVSAVPTQGAFTGKVMDSKSGESLVGVEVSILNTEYKTYTDLDGNFNFRNLPEGKYDVVLSLISYNKSLIDDIKVEKGKVSLVDVKLMTGK